MGKGKKKKNKNKSFYKSVKPFIQDNRVLYSILGAVGVGVALASAFGTERGRSMVDKLTSAVKDLVPDQLTADNAEPELIVPERKIKSTKQFAAE
ncbi:hypothetical protein AAE02nite_37730 [Adhaeribacter aerolatus]|uniref:Uncharacterized protein n=1 Tax=Adhaeribacter aerolatus TaxID=670289 RepID=A0A512B2D7_9BACT|nr:hypothetical protein [Adhaeribacter aerolatus]GEO06109.1 hypothetical protein AAE02nite_37730 [Adhaeribacter aerolatus]